METDPTDPAGAAGELADLLRFYEDPAAVLSGVVGLAQRRIPAAEEVSVILIREGRPATVAATGRLAADLDETQQRRGHGPCLDAGLADEILSTPDWATETRWPDYGAEARRLGLGSSVSFPLPVESFLVGALNVYARQAHAFDPASVELGAGLAAQLSLWLSYAEREGVARARAMSVQEALRSRATIDRAKGIVMMQRACSATEAFTRLRETAAARDLALTRLAEEIVREA